MSKRITSLFNLLRKISVCVFHRVSFIRVCVPCLCSSREIHFFIVFLWTQQYPWSLVFEGCFEVTSFEGMIVKKIGSMITKRRVFVIYRMNHKHFISIILFYFSLRYLELLTCENIRWIQCTEFPLFTSEIHIVGCSDSWKGDLQS